VASGLVRSLDDIGNVVVRAKDGVPIFVRQIAQVQLGSEVRIGALVKNGVTESVGAIVMMTAGGNAKEIVGRIKARVAEINRSGALPDGMQIVPFYDRSELVDAALYTVTKVLIEGVLLVVVVLFLFLGDVRSSLIVVATLSLDASDHLYGYECQGFVGQLDEPWWVGDCHRADG
jgi:cobalt-zinc-cadmium resistance protein CzcA